MRHTYHFLLVAFLSLIFTATVFAQVPQEIQPNETVRIDANLVTVPTQVMDRDGRFIADLKKDDFQIFEDGVEQKISFFEPVEEPFTILFLLDVSGSMSHHLAELAAAANTFLSQLRPDDRLIAISFCDEVQTLSELASVRETKGIKMFKLRVCGHNTYVYDAVDHAFKRVRKIRGRKAIVLFSDGFSGNRFATAKSTLRDAEEQEALIYTIQFNTAPKEPPRTASRKHFYETIKNADNYMTGLAQKTGGRHYRVEELSDLAKSFASVADELRRQYTLGYYPKRPLREGQRRQITVRVRRKGVAVRARDSYVAVPPHDKKR
jgi:Ca-activated chloride channel homolog